MNSTQESVGPGAQSAGIRVSETIRHAGGVRGWIGVAGAMATGVAGAAGGWKG